MLAPIRLGKTAIETHPLGVGTWAWGDERVWEFDKNSSVPKASEAFHAALEKKITFFDTAEVYGNGVSEKLIGEFLRERTGNEPAPLIATKFAPLPTRLSSSVLSRFLDASLDRLGVEQVTLYQIHWPFTMLSLKGLMDRLADAVAGGKTRAVGVSNYSADQMRRAHDALEKHGIPLASNQVHYSLMHRHPESKGILDACRDLGVTLIAYSPLAMGALTGKYGPERMPSARLRRIRGFFRDLNSKASPLLSAMREIGEEHNRTLSQVALNWLARQPGVLPIPGAKDGQQAVENAGAVEFNMADEEWKRLDELSRPWRPK